MLDEILEESWTYQEIFQKGYLKGLELAKQQQKHPNNYVMWSV